MPPDNNKAFAKTVINILEDKKKCAEIKNNLKESVKIHYIPNIIKKWEKEYSKLIRNKKK